ncbi:MAG: hypothetical protein R3320_11825 [Nitriliruptorales bacterium]|nr:hypothetical protein [Nitriliruptorales bacterium]
MEIHDQAVQLGWEGDDGFGDLLIARLQSGALTVLYEPAALLDDDEAMEIRTSEGEHVTVFDSEGEPRCNVAVREVFETTWGDPDPRLVAGDGYGEDVEGWRRGNGGMLSGALEDAGEELDDDTVLLVQRVEVTEVFDGE